MSQEIQNQDSPVQSEVKSDRQGRIIWITGLSGSGKTTLSTLLDARLREGTDRVYTLDGDLIRQGLNSDLGFSDEDRKENIRRIGEVARLFVDADFIVIVAFISPFKADRDKVRQATEPGRFLEVYLDCPLKVCEQRDPKGLYKKARLKKIEKFTGISSPYEPPGSPEVTLRTHERTAEECVQEIIDCIKKHS